MAVLLGVGAAAVAGGVAFRRSRLPEAVPPEVAAEALAEVREVVRLVRESEFGRSERGATLTARVARFIEDGRLRFSAELESEALYRKGPGCAPILYVGVHGTSKGFVLPGRGQLAERIYHETLHAVKQSAKKTYEEECDAFCAAEEARAAVEGRPPDFPVTRDGLVLWRWVGAKYEGSCSDPDYVPVGQTLRDLARKTGIDYVEPGGRGATSR
jgi:hypothetical protein